MIIKPIKNKKDYEAALVRVEDLMSAKIGTEEGDELEILSILIERYEEKKYEILPPDPIEAIKFRMEHLGMKKKDLAEIIGANRTSEVLSGKRSLTLKMIRDLHVALRIPVDSLVGI